MLHITEKSWFTITILMLIVPILFFCKLLRFLCWDLELHLLLEEAFPFMACCTLCAINMRTKIQLNHFILLFLYCLFGVYAMIFIYMFIVKESLYICVIYAATLYHHSERYFPNFSWLESWCDLGRGICYFNGLSGVYPLLSHRESAPAVTSHPRLHGAHLSHAIH